MKKLIGMTFVGLFMMSMTNSKNIFEEKDCIDQINIFITQAENSGYYDQSEIDWLYNGAIAVYCYGYTWDDVYNAP